jgi:hypothetical protein
MKRKGGVDYSVIIGNSLDSLEEKVEDLMKEIYDKHTKSKRTQIEEYNKLAEHFRDIDAQIKQKLAPGDSTRSKLFGRLDELREKIEPAEAMLRFGQEVPVSKKSESTPKPIEELKPIRQEEAPKIKEANEKLGGRSKKRTRKASKAFKKNKNNTRKA